jgi:tetratricopeptide (TPR) repeat protein
MPELRKVFISHSHNDEPLASAFRDTLKQVFSNVDVAFSSDKTAGGGVPTGSNWLEWIHDRMLDCQESLLLLTPYSIRKPWPMWEAGAVGGMALAASPEDASSRKRVTPIRFNIPQEALPGPFVVTQAVDGRNDVSLRKLLGDLMSRYDYAATSVIINAVLNEQVPRLSSKIHEWLENAPPVVTDDMVTEWCSRLDALREEKRSGEVRHLHRWIRLMYEGPRARDERSDDWTGRQQLAMWDLRLHLRLAQNYAIASQFQEAIEQYRLAAELAPLDVFVLHRLAQAYLEVKDADAARKTIDHILALDPDALTWNAEVAGLEGRYWKDEGRKRQAEDRAQQAEEAFRRALKAYQAAMQIEPDKVDYYMADNVGQLSLTLGDMDAARDAYRRARAALERVPPELENVWTLATRVTTALVLTGDEQEALAYLVQIRELSPTDAQKKSISRGLELVAKALGKTSADHRRWVGAIDG